MKVYVLLDLNGEYHGYDIYLGVFKTFEDALNNRLERWSPLGSKLGYVYHTHRNYPEDSKEIRQEFNTPHTHVVLFDKTSGVVSKKDLIAALEHNDENDFYDWGYNIYESVVIEEVEL